MVTIVRNPVHSALSLIVNLMSIAVLYYTLNAPFLMAVQLIVYAGAIVVLFLFVVMLLNSSGEEAASPTLAWVKPVGVVSALGFLLAVAYVLKVDLPASAASHEVVGDPAAIGRMLYRQYLLPFEATSVLLMAALVGSLYLGRRFDKGDGSEDTGGKTDA